MFLFAILVALIVTVVFLGIQLHALKKDLNEELNEISEEFDQISEATNEFAEALHTAEGQLEKQARIAAFTALVLRSHSGKIRTLEGETELAAGTDSTAIWMVAAEDACPEVQNMHFTQSNYAAERADGQSAPRPLHMFDTESDPLSSLSGETFFGDGSGHQG
jgi:hypothetical protein